MYVSKLYEIPPDDDNFNIIEFGKAKREKDREECKPVYWNDTTNQGLI